MSLHEDFEFTVEDLGPPTEPVYLTDTQLDFAKRHLPESYVEFLEMYGYGAYFSNGYQFVDPQALKPLAALIFGADKDLSPDDCHIVAYSAFGKLQAWSERHWTVEINLLDYQVWCDNLFATEFDLPANLPPPKLPPDPNRIAVGLLPFDEDYCELWDFEQEPMFARCVEAHGALARGECYGFVPSLGLLGFEGRHRVVENVKRFPALEHFAMIAQMRPFRLTRLGKSGYEHLREIG